MSLCPLFREHSKGVQLLGNSLAHPTQHTLQISSLERALNVPTHIPEL